MCFKSAKQRPCIVSVLNKCFFLFSLTMQNYHEGTLFFSWGGGWLPPWIEITFLCVGTLPNPESEPTLPENLKRPHTHLPSLPCNWPWGLWPTGHTNAWPWVSSSWPGAAGAAQHPFCGESCWQWPLCLSGAETAQVHTGGIHCASFCVCPEWQGIFSVLMCDVTFTVGPGGHFLQPWFS